MKLRIATLLSLSLLSFLHPGAGHAAFHLSAVGLGLNSSTPLGSNYQLLDRKLGVVAEGWAQHDALLGPNWLLHAEARYQPFGIRPTDRLSLTQATLLVGVESRSERQSGWLRPFSSFDIGLNVASMRYEDADNTPNASSGLALQWKPGLHLYAYRNFGLTFAMPLTTTLGGSKLTTLGAIFSLRWML